MELLAQRAEQIPVLPPESFTRESLQRVQHHDTSAIPS